jgi:hypothetical protein
MLTKQHTDGLEMYYGHGVESLKEKNPQYHEEPQVAHGAPIPKKRTSSLPSILAGVTVPLVAVGITLFV